MAYSSCQPLENDLVDLYLAHQIHFNDNNSKSKDIPTLISAHISHVHFMDRFECVYDCLDAYCDWYVMKTRQNFQWPWNWRSKWLYIVFTGFTFHIPDAVMGLTFLAAGGCMPEGISSVLMIRKNEGGVGVSNSLGANSLAILMSLGIPWLIKNIINRNTPGKQSILLNPNSTEYNMLLLLLAVIALYTVLTIAKYRLKRAVGVALISVYIFCITIGILLEMDVFFPNIICS